MRRRCFLFLLAAACVAARDDVVRVVENRGSSTGSPPFHVAAWIPSSYDAATPEELCAQLVSLQETAGVDRVYLDVWNQGTAYFASPTLAAAGLGNSSAQGDDRLGWAAQECPAFQGDIVAWFEYGLISAYGSAAGNPFAEYAAAQEWVLGQEGGAGFVWLDVNSGALDFLANLLTDVVRGYGSSSNSSDSKVRGVQLDDHFAQPTGLTGGGPTAVRDMTAGAERLSASVRTAAAAIATVAGVDEQQQQKQQGPTAAAGGGGGGGGGASLLSLSPAPLSTALGSYSVDWQEWVAGDEPLFDEVVPQLYRDSFASFEPLLQETLEALYGPTAEQATTTAIAEEPGRSTAKPNAQVAAEAAAAKANDANGRANLMTDACGLAIGLRLDGSGAPTPWADLEQMLDAVADASTPYGGPGSVSPSIWYSRGILETYPDELAAYFNDPGSCSSDCYNCVLYGGGYACEDKCTSCGSACTSCIEGGGGTACASKCQ